MFFGQINLFLVLLIVLDCTKSTRWQGIGTGLAAAIKLTPLPFIAFFLITRQWRAAIRAGSVFMVATGLAWVVLPSASWGYWTNPSASLRRVGGIPTFTNQSLHGMFEVLGLPMWGLAIAVIGVTAAGMVAARRQYEGGDILGAACCVGLVTLLISPVSWVHHGVWIVPIAGILVAGGRDALRTSAVAVLVVFFVLRLPLLGSVLLAHGGPSPLAKLLEVSDVLAYLALLAANLGERVRTKSMVMQVGRKGHLREENSPGRAKEPFRMLVRAGDGGLRLPPERHGDFFTGLGAAPHRNGFVALEHGVVGEERGEGDVGAGDGKRRGKHEESGAKRKIHRRFRIELPEAKRFPAECQARRRASPGN